MMKKIYLFSSFAFLFCFTFCNSNITNDKVLNEFTKELLIMYINDSIGLDFNSNTHNIVLNTYSDKNNYCISVYAYQKELFLPNIYYQTIFLGYNLLFVGESNNVFFSETIEPFFENKTNNIPDNQLVDDNPDVWQICLYKNYEINPLRTFKVTPFDDFSIFTTLVENHYNIDKTIDVLYNSDTLSSISVDKPPFFSGGEDSLRSFIKMNFFVPEQHILKKRVLILVGVIIDKNGKVRNPFIIKSSGILELDNEALRVVSSLPDFSPPLHRGNPVTVNYAIPVEID